MTDTNTKRTGNSDKQTADGPRAAPAGAPILVSSPTGSNEVVELLLDLIDPSPHQSATRLVRKKDVDELMTNMAANGQIQPILVSPSEEVGRHVVHSGHRRCAALRYLGRKTVKAIIRKLTEREARRLVIGDNLGRKDLSAIEKAMALKDFCDAYPDVDLDAAAAELGVKRATAYRLKSLLAASDSLQELFAHGRVSPVPAEALAKIEARDPRRALRLAERFVAGDLTTADIQKAAKNVASKVRGAAAHKAVQLAVNEREIRLNITLKWHQVELGGPTMTEVTLAMAKFLGQVGIRRVEAAVDEERDAKEGAR